MFGMACMSVRSISACKKYHFPTPAKFVILALRCILVAFVLLANKLASMPRMQPATCQHQQCSIPLTLCLTLIALPQIASLLPFFKFGFFASSLIFMLIYVWSRNFPTSSVSLMGLVSIEVCNVYDNFDFPLPSQSLVLSLEIKCNGVLAELADSCCWLSHHCLLQACW